MYNILQIVGKIVWENVMSLVDVKLVRMEHDYQTVIGVSKHLSKCNAGFNPVIVAALSLSEGISLVTGEVI